MCSGSTSTYIEFDPGTRTVHLKGRWTTGNVGRLWARIAALEWPRQGEVRIAGHALEAFDTAGAWLLAGCLAGLEAHGCALRLEGLDRPYQRLLALARERPQASPGGLVPPSEGLFAQIGRTAVGYARETYALAAFVGETAAALGRTALRPGRLHGRALLAQVQLSGFNAVPIVGLLAFLIGVVVAYQGAIQLRTYGANIFIVELVTLTSVRELAPLLAAIIVAGRTGSAYTAQIASMRVSEEIDALRAMGVDPVELLVLPRVLGLLIALPLLTVFADAMAVLGGMVMGVAMLDLPVRDFALRIPEAVSLTSFAIGIGKTPVFAAILALVGCFHGFQAARSAAAVGERTTRSVVEGIFLVIVADALFSVVFSALGV